MFSLEIKEPTSNTSIRLMKRYGNISRAGKTKRQTPHVDKKPKDGKEPKAGRARMKKRFNILMKKRRESEEIERMIQKMELDCYDGDIE